VVSIVILEMISPAHLTLSLPLKVQISYKMPCSFILYARPFMDGLPLIFCMLIVPKQNVNQKQLKNEYILVIMVHHTGKKGMLVIGKV
jgi:hypothetical protein